MTAAAAKQSGDRLAEPCAPQLAGARARGFADAFALLGMPAILLDKTGYALHVNCEAGLMLGSQIAIDGGRVMAADSDADRLLQDMIPKATAGQNQMSLPISTAFGDRACDSRLRIHVLPVPGACEDEFQLLGCVVLLERVGDDAGFGLNQAVFARLADSFGASPCE